MQMYSMPFFTAANFRQLVMLGAQMFGVQGAYTGGQTGCSSS